MTIKTVIGVDPGKNIGFSRIDAEDQKIVYSHKTVIHWSMFCVTLSAMEDFARDSRDPVTFVVEDFRLFAHKANAQIGSRMDASQVIGAIKYAVSRANGKIELVMQEPSILATAAIWSGEGVSYVHKKQHMPDQLSAYNHAHYYLTTKGLLRHRVLDA